MTSKTVRRTESTAEPTQRGALGREAFPSVLGAVAFLVASFGSATAQTVPTSAWSPPEMAPIATAHERLPYLHADAFLWRKPAAGTGQNTRTAAIALGEFDSAQGPDLISVQDDGTLMLSRNWELHLGEPTPPQILNISLPPFLWDPRHAECEIWAAPVSMGSNSPRQALAILTQAPPQLILVVDPVVAPQVRTFAILPITPRSLEIIDVDLDGRDEIFFAQNHRFEARPDWFRFLGFVYLSDEQGHGVADAFDLGTGPGPIVDTALADMDRDGRIDLVMAEATRFHIWMQDASGRFVPTSSSPLQPFPVQQIAVGDLNGDQAMDVALRGSFGVRAYLRGSTRFPAPDISFDTSFASWMAGAQGRAPALSDFELRDLNGDGLSDFLLALEARTCLVAWKVEPGGRLASPTLGRRLHGYTNDRMYPAGATWLVPNRGGKIVCADIDLDGDLDAYLCNPSASHVLRFLNRVRQDIPELHSIDVPYAALRAGGPAGSSVSVSFEYTPPPSFRPGQATMIFRLFRQTPQGFDPVPLRTWAASAAAGQVNLSQFALPRSWWNDNERLAFIITSFTPPLERTGAVFWISGALDRGGQQNGNGTTSCPQKHEQVVWETEYGINCREGSNVRASRRTAVGGRVPGTTR